MFESRKLTIMSDSLPACDPRRSRSSALANNCDGDDGWLDDYASAWSLMLDALTINGQQTLFEDNFEGNYTNAEAVTPIESTELQGVESTKEDSIQSRTCYFLELGFNCQGLPESAGSVADFEI